MITKQTFAQVAQVLHAVYFRTAVSDDTWLAYFLALADIPEATLLKAVSEHIAQSDDFPTIAQLRRLALADQAPAAGEAWNEINQQIQQIGRYRKPSFSHSLIARAIAQLGSWRELCASENPVVDRAHFLRIYEELARRESAGKVAFPNLGNSTNHPLNSPKRIHTALQPSGNDAIPGEGIQTDVK